MVETTVISVAPSAMWCSIASLSVGVQNSL